MAIDLNPGEITVEAWVRVPDGSCGTLVGNGQDTSYWLGSCDVLQFGHGGPHTVRLGQHFLGEGWHHVGATMHVTGTRTLFLDGQLELQPGWDTPHEERPGKEKERDSLELGMSERLMRFGSDRHASQDTLYGYVSELRIWDHARSPDEIRKSAFVRLTGSEPGLLGLWPLADGMVDVVGGNHAGLMGNAALAREAPLHSANCAHLRSGPEW